MNAAARQPDPERILLVRTSALGDVVQALPVLHALRRRYPAAEIAWAVDEAFAPLLAGHACLDRLYAVPLRRWRRERSRRLRELVRFTRELRAFRADVAVDLMGNHKGALLARLSGAKRRLGHARGDRREPSSAIWLTATVPASGRHAVERVASLLAPLGADGTHLQFDPDAIACGRTSVPAGDYVYLHPGAAWGNKRYSAQGWAEVATILRANDCVEVRVGAAPGEEELAATIVDASRGSARLLPAPSLDELAGAVRGARLVLGGDTGAIHLARAFGRPVVAVFGPTDPERHGPWSDPGGVVVHRLTCSFCHRRMAEAKSCLAGVTPAEIASRAIAQLGRAPV